MKFLIIRFSSIGDIVLTTPVIRCLKKQMPGVEIHFLTKKAYRDVLEGNPYIDNIYFLDSGSRKTLIKELKNNHYDFIADLHHNLRSFRIKWALKTIPNASFPKLNIEKWLLTALKIHRLPHLHIVDRYLSTLKKFNIKNDQQGLDFYISDTIAEKELPIPPVFTEKYIAIVIGAALNTKKMPLALLKIVCNALSSFPIILIGGKEDRRSGEMLMKYCPGALVYNSCGILSLQQSALAVKKAALVISNDTGFMHIAAAFKKPIISVWGNTVPEFGMTPYYIGEQEKRLSFISEVKDLECRPCSKIGYKNCPRKHFNCMRLQQPDAIIKQAYYCMQHGAFQSDNQ